MKCVHVFPIRARVATRNALVNKERSEQILEWGESHREDAA